MKFINQSLNEDDVWLVTDIDPCLPGFILVSANNKKAKWQSR